jgi:hypothetical protein
VAESSVTVFSPILQLTGLIGLVRADLHEGGIDNAGVARSLLSKLTRARAAIIRCQRERTSEERGRSDERRDSDDEDVAPGGCRQADRLLAALAHEIEAEEGRHISRLAAALPIGR